MAKCKLSSLYYCTTQPHNSMTTLTLYTKLQQNITQDVAPACLHWTPTTHSLYLFTHVCSPLVHHYTKLCHTWAQYWPTHYAKYTKHCLTNAHLSTLLAHISTLQSNISHLWSECYFMSDSTAFPEHTGRGGGHLRMLITRYNSEEANGQLQQAANRVGSLTSMEFELCAQMACHTAPNYLTEGPKIQSLSKWSLSHNNSQVLHNNFDQLQQLDLNLCQLQQLDHSTKSPVGNTSLCHQFKHWWTTKVANT